jgi:hypothetical protein
LATYLADDNERSCIFVLGRSFLSRRFRSEERS